MNHPDGQQHLYYHNRAFGLIEVIAALALLGGTIVALVTAQTRSLEQFTASNHQRQATYLAEELLAKWILEEQEVTTESQGHFANATGWFWHRITERIVVGDEHELIRIQLAIIRMNEIGAPQTITSYTWLSKPDVREQ